MATRTSSLVLLLFCAQSSSLFQLLQSTVYVWRYGDNSEHVFNVEQNMMIEAFQLTQNRFKWLWTKGRLTVCLMSWFRLFFYLEIFLDSELHIWHDNTPNIHHTLLEKAVWIGVVPSFHQKMVLLWSNIRANGGVMRAEHTEDSSPQKSDFPKNLALTFLKFALKRQKTSQSKPWLVETSNFTRQIQH